MITTALLAAGVALALAVSSGADREVSGWVLKYERPTGPFENAEFKSVLDPTPATEPTMRLSQIASSCRLASYKSASNLASSDVNEAAWLELSRTSEAELSCLRRFVVPPYITLEAAS